jgi:hypothetical protein
MLELGIDMATIVKASGLSHAEVEEIRMKRTLSAEQKNFSEEGRH